MTLPSWSGLRAVACGAAKQVVALRDPVLNCDGWWQVLYGYVPVHQCGDAPIAVDWPRIVEATEQR